MERAFISDPSMVGATTVTVLPELEALKPLDPWLMQSAIAAAIAVRSAAELVPEFALMRLP
jgi:hypothetical protein